MTSPLRSSWICLRWRRWSCDWTARP